MALRVYNTLTGSKEEFVPINPGKVGMYVCGVTVYDHCHIGHARANVVFDMIYRYLQAKGLDVTYVRNYTDIDDKIINRANRDGVPYNEISERFIEEFDKDMARLMLQLPTFQPKATEHIPEIIALVQRLIDKGYAYASGSDVFFRVDRFEGYLKLSKRNLEDMQAGARIEVDEKKEHPMDFALWKGAKPGEPYWESPWGHGRPGWHIECSAMSTKFLGDTLDIHGGGKDLIFPHHENEIAQSEAASGKPFVKYWLHNGFVNINSEKMSKSLGNFFTIKDVLERYDAEVLRFFLLSAHYRSPIDFSDQNLKEAELGLERIYKALAGIDERLAAGTDHAATEESAELEEKCGSIGARFTEAMDDDFNTAMALGHVFDLVRSINRALPVSPLELLARVKREVANIATTLGVCDSVPVEFMQRMKDRKTSDMEIPVEEIEALIAERAEARKAKDFKRSDEIRDLLLAKNIVLLDGKEGTTWSVK
ncbi:cysteine--tRNA ligase [Geomonas subterranea]|uniref:Cysteine--tRNA ligase n=1 Tax=Geomonas subterranea TaxID=2847989 RepID=A0ABX8LHT2_9BACT|nr:MULTISPECIES: cysteine--tRNA ligase [Geomonas]QXE90297.1 cysteine--tRNA ligase [Geomonas subterranea]QXM07577.1 cysteine--tRNA ligase [Geomonas subterranea]